jgi:hypothetical protein
MSELDVYVSSSIWDTQKPKKFSMDVLHRIRLAEFLNARHAVLLYCVVRVNVIRKRDFIDT